ncbi:MAG: isoprenylcysteine carboxylmethyltransferase family protein [Planctomycetes bacterium]|nr:isoprenylcysteine carboxylmethyltransferase family protein [Planctomycetota bacterium]
MLAWPHVVGLSILLVELPHLFGRRSDKAQDRRADRASLRSLWLAIGCGIAGAYYLRASAVGPLFDLSTLVLAAALVLVFLGCALRLWAVKTLGRLFTVDVAIRAGHSLVTSGPFRFVRHPSYTGLLAMFVGWSVTFANVASAVALLAPLTIALFYRLHVEESALSGAFGADYAEYCARTKRLVPFVY